MIAYDKGHNFLKWWIFGAVLIPAALPMVIFLKPVQKLQAEVNGMKKCSYCAELIRAEALVCQFCGHNLEVASEPVRPVGITSVLGNIKVGYIQKDGLIQGGFLASILFLIFAMVMMMLANLQY